ncbi:MAG: dockerin type I domain-containing protein, partial [Planctomycetota bacterium]
TAEEPLPEEPAAEEVLPEEPAAEEPLPEEPAAEEPPSEEPSAGPGPEAEAELLDLLEIRASVFLDRNGDGLWNEGESGVEGAVVTLRLEPCGSFPEEETSGVTGAGGTCRFEVAEAAGPQGEPCSSRLYLDLSQGAAAGYATTTPNPQEVRLVRDEPGGGAAFGVRLPVANAEMRVERVLAVSEQTVEARVFLTAPDPVEGFVTALRHDPRLRLESISIEGTAAAENGADFSSFDLVPGGGTAGVVMDLFEPFLGNTIPPGDNLPVARYAFSCPQVAAGEPQLELPLELVDGVFGNPPKENIIVVGGRSLSPVLVPGAILVSPESIPGGVRFLAGGPLGEDGLPRDLVGTAGETLELNFYYDLPLGGGPGTPSEDGLQGLSMALAYDCQVEVLEGSFRLPPDSAALLAGAEYVNFHADNSSADGDGCEMVLGLLVDAQAPFEGNVLPAGAGPQRIAAADVRIAAAALCNVCLPVEFQDGVNGRGKIPARNLYAAGNQSFPAATRSTRVCVTPEAAFKRGDCNGDGKINTTDAAVTIMFLFPFWSGAYSPDCFDACDANDNGSIEVTDAVRVLRWLFLGGEVPPPPGVERPGPDPTPDALGCERRPCPPR